MGQALYRKYRSKSLQEVIGQEHVTTTLEQALKQGHISHAYLFTGPRGVGKTSVARILAHAVNGLPYTDDSAHLDIIEIDAASNRRIDEIRELRDKVYVAPTNAKYKVYIIDEVHMLTREAFNALLKTLEEPPEHAIFILATTDAHKLPDTIVSRTQRFTFKPVDIAKVVEHLADIAKHEKIKISPEALRLLAEHGEGSFRDSISLLDQLSSHSKTVEVEDVRALLGMPSASAIDGLLEAIDGGSDTTKIMTQLESLFLQGYQPAAIAKQLSARLRARLTEGRSGLPVPATLALLKRLIEVPASYDPERFLEISLLSAQPVAPVSQSAAEVREAPKTTVQAEPKPETQPRNDETPAPERTVGPAPAAGDAAFDEGIWPKVLETLKRKHNTLYGVVRMAEPTFSSENTLKLAFAFAFHEKRIKEASNRRKLADVLYELTGKHIEVECVLDKTAQPPVVTLEVEEQDNNGEKTEGKETGKDLTAISNIFGTAELLES